MKCPHCGHIEEVKFVKLANADNLFYFYFNDELVDLIEIEGNELKKFGKRLIWKNLLEEWREKNGRQTGKIR